MFEAVGSAAIVIAHVGAALTVLMSERRAPSATLAWLLTLIFLPIVGLFLYLIIGRTRARRVARRYERVVKALRPILEKYDVHRKLTEAGSSPPDQRTVSLLALGDRLASTPASCGNSVEILVNAQATYDSMEAAAKEAEHHLHVEFYIVKADETGRRLRDILTERASAGVEVRVVCDGIGSGSLPHDFWHPLLQAGGKARYFRPASRLLTRLPLRDRLDFRNHRKLVIADGRVGFTGGINVGREYLGRDPHVGYWRDTHVRIAGPAVLSLQKAFAEDWLDASDELLDNPVYFPDLSAEDDGPYSVQVIDSGPDRTYSPISFLFAQSFAVARERIWITSPYFIPNQSIEEGLIAAALRGVDVRLLVPQRPDRRIVGWAAASYYPTLLEAGVRIFEYARGFVHAKTVVVDEWVGTVGSANMDMRSFHLNYELNALVHGARFCQELAGQFERDLQNAVEIDRGWTARNRPVTRFLHASARIFSPLL